MNVQSFHNVTDMRIISDTPSNSNAVKVEIEQNNYMGKFTTEITLFGDAMPLDKRKALIEALS